jgi:hypothetical protein
MEMDITWTQWRIPEDLSQTWKRKWDLTIHAQLQRKTLKSLVSMTQLCLLKMLSSLI